MRVDLQLHKMVPHTAGSGGTVDTLIGRKIPIKEETDLQLHKSVPKARNGQQLANKWDFEGRKVFDDLGALSRRENRCAEGGTRTHTRLPSLPPQDSVSTSSTTSANIILNLPLHRQAFLTQEELF